MYDTATILVIFGSILFVLAIFGGGMSVKEIKIPSIQSRVRILLYPVSIIFIITGVWLSRQPPPTAEFPGNQLPPETTSLTTPSQLETKTPLTDPFSCKVFSDDFETGVQGENELSWGSWKHENGEYRMRIFGSNYLSVSCKLCNNLYQKDFRITVTARTPQPQGSWGIYFWGKDKIRYSFELDENSNAVIKQYDDYDYNILDSTQVNLSTTNRLTIEYLNGILVGYINGEQIVRYSIPSPPVIGNYGVGLIEASLSSDSADVFFDDFSFSGCPK